MGSGVIALTSLTATLLGAVQLDAGLPLSGPDLPREVRELRGLFACRPVFLEAAQLLLAGLRVRRARTRRDFHLLSNLANCASSGFSSADTMFSATLSISFWPQNGSVVS